MKGAISAKKKIGDLLCDIGKYMLTVVPFSFMLSDKPGLLYVTIITTFSGIVLILFGLYFIKHSESVSASGNAQKRKIRILKNSVFVVEEEK